MCYNKVNECKVTIKSCGNGWSDTAVSRGNLTYGENGEISLAYKICGDDCVLKINGTVITQQRRGEQNLFLEFEEGANTTCTIGGGDMSGTFGIYTKKIKLIRGKAGISLKLGYVSGEDGEEIKLRLTATVSG